MESKIRSIVGKPLSAVSFVYDYVEMHFDESIIRALTDIEIEHDGCILRVPECGSRDLLCSIIGHKAIEVKIRKSDILIIFDSGKSVRVSITPKEDDGPEAAHFFPGPHKPIEVW